jgi:C1A family cysteine protease
MNHCDRRFNGIRVLLFAVFFVFLASFGASSAEAKLKAMDVNPKYIEYWERVKSGERPGGLTPSPINWAALKKEGAAARKSAAAGGISSAAAALPSAYDLVAEGVTPPVLNQKGWGTCWSFGAMEAIESGIMSADKTNGTSNYKDLSEMHLAYYAYVDEAPGKPAFTGYPPQADRNPIFDNGGTVDMVIALLSRGTGPLLFSDAPYPELKTPEEYVAYIPNPAPPKGPAQFRLKNAYYFLNDAETIKSALMKFGALSFAYGSYDDTVSGDYCIYTPDSRPGNHMVLLVGWDDNYPKEAFLTEPSKNGAWKLQNSWGAEHGRGGYYWISYEDKTLFGGEDVNGLPSAFEMMPADAYDGIYFHDPLGASRILNTANDRITAANAFTAERDEKIVYVGFNTAQDDQDCEIQVYRNIPDGGSPGAGKAVFAAPVICHVSDGGGYISAKLDNPVQIAKGERFAVTVTFKRPAEYNEAAIPIEDATVPGIAPGYQKAVLNPGESYYLLGGESGNAWRDIYYYDVEGARGNFCVKALTVSSPAPSGGGSSGGCDAGLGAFALVLIGLSGALLRKRR